jgi:hypothetical protein
MDQKQVIKDSFRALCMNMEHKAYEDASEIVALLACFQEKLTSSQLEQLVLAWQRLEYIYERESDSDNEPE